MRKIASENILERLVTGTATVERGGEPAGCGGVSRGGVRCLPAPHVFFFKEK